MAEGRADAGQERSQGRAEGVRGADALMHVPTTGLELARAQAAVGSAGRGARHGAAGHAHPRRGPASRLRSRLRATRPRRSTIELEARIPSLTVNVKNVPDRRRHDARPSTVSTCRPRSSGNRASSTPGITSSRRRPGRPTASRRSTSPRRTRRRSPSSSPPRPRRRPRAARPIPDDGCAQQQPEQPAEPEGRSGGSKVMIFGGFGLAAVGAIAGTVTGILSISKTSSIKSSTGLQRQRLQPVGGRRHQLGEDDGDDLHRVLHRGGRRSSRGRDRSLRRRRIVGRAVRDRRLRKRRMRPATDQSAACACTCAVDRARLRWRQRHVLSVTSPRRRRRTARSRSAALPWLPTFTACHPQRTVKVPGDSPTMCFST